VGDLLVVGSDGGDPAFLCEDVERDGEGVLHLFEEVGVVAETVTREQGANLSGREGTWSSSAT
jgi:hypothetical protein